MFDAGSDAAVHPVVVVADDAAQGRPAVTGNCWWVSVQTVWIWVAASPGIGILALALEREIQRTRHFRGKAQSESGLGWDLVEGMSHSSANFAFHSNSRGDES